MTGTFVDFDGLYPHLKEAFGWWRFPAKYFQMDPLVNWDAGAD